MEPRVLNDKIKFKPPPQQKVINAVKKKFVPNKKENSSASDLVVRRPRFCWNSKAEEDLIDEYAKKVFEFNDPNNKQQMKLWEQLAKHMQKRSHQVQWSQCFSKFHSIKKKFKEIYYNADVAEDLKCSLFPLYQKLSDLFFMVVDDKVRVKKEILEKQQEFEDEEALNRTLEDEKTQYIVEMLEESIVDQEIMKSIENVAKTDEKSQKYVLLPNSSSKTNNLPNEVLYMEKKMLKVELNTPLSRTSNPMTKTAGNNIRKRALESHLNDAEATGNLKITKMGNSYNFIKPEPLSIQIKREISSQNLKTYRVAGSKLNKVELQGNGKLLIHNTPLPKTVRQQNRDSTMPSLNLTQLQDENGMITLLDSCDNSEISTINAHEHSNTIKADNFTNNDSNSIKNQPQSTKNDVSVSSPDITFDNQSRHSENLVKYVKNGLSTSTLPPTPLSTSSNVKNNNVIKITTDSTNGNGKFTLQHNNVTISGNNIVDLVNKRPQAQPMPNRNLNSTPNNNRLTATAETLCNTLTSPITAANESIIEAPIWFQSFLLKFQTMLHRQNSIEEKLDNLNLNVLKLRKKLEENSQKRN